MYIEEHDERRDIKLDTKIEKKILKLIKTAKPQKPVYVKFSVYPKELDGKCEIPATAERTARKVFIYQNAETNDITFIKPVDAYIIEGLHRQYRLDLQYFEDLDIVGCFAFAINARAIDNINIELMNQCFISREKEICGKHYYAEELVYSPSMAAWAVSGYEPFSNDNAFWANSIQKLFPFALCGGNTYSIINDVCKLQSFIRYKEPKLRDTKTQREIDELLKIDLPEPPTARLTKKSKKEAKNNYISWWENMYGNTSMLVSPVKDDMVCLRWFKFDVAGNTLFETSRMYVDKKKNLFCRKNSFGQYIAQTGKMQPTNFRADKVILPPKSKFKGTKLEYYKDIIKEIPAEKKAAVLWAFLYHPKSEMFWKQGMKSLVLDFVGEYWCATSNFDKFVADRYGDINSSGKNVYSILGINKYQVSVIDRIDRERHNAYRSCLRQYKECFGVTDISPFTNEQFDEVTRLVENSVDSYWNSASCSRAFGLLRKCYSLKTAFHYIDKLLEMKDKNVSCEYFTGYHTYTTNMNAVAAYSDYLDMVNKMDASHDLRPKFETAEDIIEMHDGALALYNMQQESIKMHMFDDRKKYWEKYKYEGDEFVVVTPSNPTDLAKEGFELHHCVKSYIDRVGEGVTNIVFIRKKEDKDTPFFTVEITNDNAIQQVHGMCNRNADTEPGMEKFVKEWAKARKLKLNNINKVR